MRIIVFQNISILFIAFFWLNACQSQTKGGDKLGGPCEGCEGSLGMEIKN